MLIVLLRHGETAYNAQRRYQGKSDIPLSARGTARLRAADFAPDVVVVTALCRTAQTAAAVFPGARQAVEDDLREMDFGDFEGKTYGELKDDPAYRAWLASGGEAACPNGEGKAAFCARVCRAFERLVDEALARGAERLVIVAHGGVIGGLMYRWFPGMPHRFVWTPDPGHGYQITFEGGKPISYCTIPEHGTLGPDPDTKIPLGD